MKLGLAIVARDEPENLPGLLASIEGAFDRVVLLDTGSTDNTVGLFEAWAAAQGVDHAVGRYEWHDDFGAARRAADELLMYGGPPQLGQLPLVDWTCWADCDDEIIHADRLRGLAEHAGDAIAVLFDYDYAQHPQTGACVCRLVRERLVRAGHGEWQGRVHEAQGFPDGGGLARVPGDIAHWKHRKQASGPDAALASNDRNLRILKEWVQDEPDNARVLGYLGKESAARGEHVQAIGYYRRYLAQNVEWGDERAQIGRHFARSLIALGRFQEAEHVALDVLVSAPGWPDTYLTLAECALERGEPAKTLEWLKRLDLTPPDTMLIINPLDYTAYPRRLQAAALADTGQVDAAVAVADEALALDPTDEFLHNAWLAWKNAAKIQHSAETYAMAAEQLIAHDEQLKALDLLERCVPHFIVDHPRIVALRSFLRARLAWIADDAGMTDHYQTGGSKPEDFHDDETSDRIAAALPRVEYLLDGLREQLAA